MSDRQQLYEFFNTHSVEGISFSGCFQGKKKGSSILFFLAVDGRELSSVNAIVKLYNQWKNKDFELKKGKAYFVLANPRAFLENRQFIEEDINNAFYFHPNQTIEGRRVLEIRNFLRNHSEISHIYRIYGSSDSDDQEIIHFTFQDKNSKQLEIDRSKANFKHIDEPKKIKIVNLTKEKEHKENVYSSLFQEVENFKAEYLEAQLGKDQTEKTENRIVEKYEAVLDYHLVIIYKNKIWLFLLTFLLLLLLLLLLLFCLIFNCFLLTNLYRPIIATPEARLELAEFDLPNFPERIPSNIELGPSWLVSDQFFTDYTFSLYLFEDKVYITATNIDGRVRTAHTSKEDFLANQNNWQLLTENLEPGFFFTNRPSVEVFQGKIYQSAVNQEDKKIYFRNSADGENWTKWQNFEDENGDFLTTEAIELFVFQDKIYQMAISQEDNRIYLRNSVDGQNWSRWLETNSPETKSITTTTIHQEKIYQAVLSSDNKVLLRKTEDGVNWSEWSETSATLEQTSALAMSAVGDQLYQFYISDRGVIYDRFKLGENGIWLQWEQRSGATNLKKASGLVKIDEKYYQTATGRDLQVYWKELSGL